MCYSPAQIPIASSFQEASKLELRGYFAWFVASIPERVRELQHAVSKTPEFSDWQADWSTASLERLSEWFVEQIETRKRTEQERASIEKGLKFQISIPDHELTSRTLSLAFDVGIYLSRVLQAEHPHLRWEQSFGTKKSADYGQAVIVGAGQVPFNPVRTAVTLAYGIADGQYGSDRLMQIYRYWSDLAKGHGKTPESGEARGV